MAKRQAAKRTGPVIGDFILAGALLIACAGIIISGDATGKRGDECIVWVDGSEAARLPLSHATNAGFRGLTLSVENGAVRVLKSDCPRKTCAHGGPIRRQGASLACVPNRVYVEIQGNLREPCDAVAR
jgi:hypothetical protein